MPRRSLRPQHSTLQPACLRRRPQRLLRLQQRSNSPNLCNSAVCPCCHYVTSIALRERLNLDTPPPAYIVPTAARRQLQSLRYSDARPCCATSSALHPATRLTRTHAPADIVSTAGQQLQSLLSTPAICRARAQPRRTATRQARAQPRRLHAPQWPLHSRHHSLRPLDRPSDAQ
jgi:hypothetical protein